MVGLFVYREFTINDVPRIFRVSALNIVTVMLILSLAGLLGQVVTLVGAPGKLAGLLEDVSAENRWVVLLLINLLLLFVGMVMDTMAAIILLAPVLLLVVVPMNVDPIHFGIVMIMNLAIGFLTPPVGVNLFVANAISKVNMRLIFVKALPFIAMSILVLMLITYIPWLSLVIPDYFYGK